MASYIIRRLLQLIPILLGVAFIFFVVFYLSGGMEKYLYSILPEKSRTAQQIAEYRSRYGLDKPLPIQYLEMVRQMVTFDFGRSKSQNNRPIIDLIARGVPNSMKLTFPGFAFGTLIAMSLGLMCAYFRGSFFDKFMAIVTIFGISLPALVMVILFQNFLAYQLKLFPIAGWSLNPVKQIRFLVLPWIIYVALGLGYDIRFFRTAFLEEINKDYVRTARSKGVSERRLMTNHVMRNAMIPILTYVVIAIPGLLLGAFFLEMFFTIPGIGYLMLEAINKWDLPVLKASVIVFTLFFVSFSLLTDILYAVVDPRVRLS